MDYIEYELNKYNEALEHQDEMERLGLETEEEYESYLYDKETEAQERLLEVHRYEE